MKAHTIPDGSQVYWDGLHYDADNNSMPADLPFYLAEAKKAGGPVLEAACGTGRLTIPLAGAGIDITGLDISAPMLRAARKKAGKKGLKIRFIRADARKFSLNGKFRLIFIPFNSMQHLHDRVSLESFFSRVKKHLAPGGRFILDVFNPDPRYLVRDNKELVPIGYYQDPYSGGEVLVNEQYSYDRAAQVSRIAWHYKLGKKRLGVKRLNMRCFYPQELDALLHYNGFTSLRKYGGFRREPFSPDSPKQIVICRKTFR
ncbi:MAG: class I SAM-dependent methyltransferase [Elusimicrobia bacterium]|nr:class I SAM-dependent methyltransferase [Elusimicrobiota bacterium]